MSETQLPLLKKELLILEREGNRWQLSIRDLCCIEATSCMDHLLPRLNRRNLFVSFVVLQGGFGSWQLLCELWGNLPSADTWDS